MFRCWSRKCWRTCRSNLRLCWTAPLVVPGTVLHYSVTVRRLSFEESTAILWQWKLPDSDWKLGFRDGGLLHEAGHKFGFYHSVRIYEHLIE